MREAHDCLYAASLMRPDSLDPYFMRAEAYRRQHNTAAEVEIFKAGLKVHPDNDYLKAWLGRAKRHLALLALMQRSRILFGLAWSRKKKVIAALAVFIAVFAAFKYIPRIAKATTNSIILVKPQPVTGIAQKTTENGPVGTLCAERVMLRTGPSIGYAALRTANLGEKVKVLENLASGWYKVEDLKGEKGYIWGAFLKLNKPVPFKNGIIAGDRVIVRSKPGLNTGIIDCLPRETKIIFVSEEGEWHKVLLPDGRSGWISADLIKEI